MPLYRFLHGSHAFDRVSPLGAAESVCPCGGVGLRDFTPTPFAKTSGLPTDFKPPSDFYRWNSEAIAAKQEARGVIREEIQNGWKPQGVENG